MGGATAIVEWLNRECSTGLHSEVFDSFAYAGVELVDVHTATAWAALLEAVIAELSSQGLLGFGSPGGQGWSEDEQWHQGCLGVDCRRCFVVAVQQAPTIQP
jgi:hypothetical protein